jgi:hypothetical protein
MSNRRRESFEKARLATTEGSADWARQRARSSDDSPGKAAPGKGRARRKIKLALLVLVTLCYAPAFLSAQMDPYFTAINYPVPKGTGMLMFLPDLQVARQGNDFFTEMGMAESGITPRWTVGAMVEGQKISGLPGAYGGLRFNTYFQLFPHDHLLHFTLYGEYEDLNQAALYKMEVSGFGGEDLTGPLALARRSPARSLEQRAIVYHDWGRLNLTFNFISETGFDTHENDFGYAWGVFWQPKRMGMSAHAAPMTMTSPPTISADRLGYGLEMIGALGNNHQFGFDWHRQQQYLGPVITYALSPRWTVHLGPAFGLPDVSDPFVLRMGLGFSF